MNLSINIIFLVFLCLGFSCSGSQHCLIGNDVFRTRFFCPSYNGNDQVFCCGELDKRYCCSRDQYDSEQRAKRKTLSPREEYENIVIINRFRYEDGSKVKAKIALLDIRREIERKKEENEERDEMRSGMLVQSFLIHILGAVISMVICLYLVYVLMRKNQTAPRDPEQIPFLQERYSQVEKL